MLCGNEEESEQAEQQQEHQRALNHKDLLAEIVREREEEDKSELMNRICDCGDDNHE